MNENLKQKFKNYGFLMSLASALFLIVQAVGRPFGFVISEDIYMIVVNAVLSCLVLLGFVTRPSAVTEEGNENTVEIKANEASEAADIATANENINKSSDDFADSEEERVAFEKKFDTISSSKRGASENKRDFGSQVTEKKAAKAKEAELESNRKNSSN